MVAEDEHGEAMHIDKTQIRSIGLRGFVRKWWDELSLAYALTWSICGGILSVPLLGGLFIALWTHALAPIFVGIGLHCALCCFIWLLSWILEKFR